jgi:hypothetical protein
MYSQKYLKIESAATGNLPPSGTIPEIPQSESTKKCSH